MPAIRTPKGSEDADTSHPLAEAKGDTQATWNTCTSQPRREAKTQPQVPLAEAEETLRSTAAKTPKTSRPGINRSFPGPSAAQRAQTAGSHN